LLSFVCLTAVLLTVAGCTSYEPKIRTGAKLPEMRTPEQVANEITKVMGDLAEVVRGIKDSKTAKEAAPTVTAMYDRMKNLVLEGKSAQRNWTPEQIQQLETQLAPKLRQAEASLTEASKIAAKKLPVPPPELAKAILNGREALQQAKKEDAKNLPALSPSEILPDKAPDSSCAVVWLLCVIILAACVGFLYRDGLWSNAIALVNVVLAGLLAMNFYEWLAKFMTNYSDGLHPYVAFFDFLALWICFILCMVIFRAITDVVSRVRVRFLKIVDQVGGIVLSLCIGWVMIGFTLVSLHAAPLAQYPLFGAFQPQNSMFLGMFAPDREWLGFTRYQSKYGYCRAGDKDDSFPPDFIEKQLLRRYHVENYMLGTPEHAILVNKKFIKAPANPAPGGGK